MFSMSSDVMRKVCVKSMNKRNREAGFNATQAF